MKLKSVRRFALAIGSVLSIFHLSFLFGFVFGEQNSQPLENGEGGSLYLLVIPAIIMIITWLYNKLGAILLIIFPIVYLFLPEAKGQFDFWLVMNAPFILFGLMLLNYIYYNKYLDKKKSRIESKHK